ncbi:hypothetical protein AHiyo8_00420 [Arthrobacter sp. Hiyo8]|nr:hypothetical protein AHiyo8_00420 [Arthrobacter sp. Hiyo8]
MTTMTSCVRFQSGPYASFARIFGTLFRIVIGSKPSLRHGPHLVASASGVGAASQAAPALGDTGARDQICFIAATVLLRT